MDLICNLGEQMDIYDCLEIIDAETEMAERQGKQNRARDEGIEAVRSMHIFRGVREEHEVQEQGMG